MKKIPEIRFPEFSGEWVEKKLGEVGRIIGGGTPNTNNDEYWNGNIIWLTPTEIINNKYISNSERKISDKGLNKSSAKLLPKGTILITTRATIGEVAIAKKECSTNQGFQSFIVKKNYFNEFFYYLLSRKIIKNEMIKKANGTTFLEINKTSLSKIKINIPLTLTEQQKIAEFLSKIDEKIEIVTKKIDKLKQYKKGLLQKMLNVIDKGEPELRFKEFSGKWVEKRLGEVCKIQNGYSFKSEKFKKSGIPIIRISNISNENIYINTSNLVFYEKISNDNSYIIKKGNLIIAMSGATTGKASIYNLNEPAYLNQRVGLFKIIDSSLLNYKFLIQLVFSKIFLKQLKSVLVAGAQPNISTKEIESFNFYLPPTLSEQQKIADFLSLIDEKIELNENKLKALKKYKQGLLQKMFV